MITAHRIGFLLSCFLILIGFLTRFYDLGEKFYWVDEVNTSIHAVGATKPEIEARLEGMVGQVATIGLLRDEIERPREAANLLAPISALVRDDPHHAPLYYLLARAWIGAFDGSPTSLRLLSAVLSLLIVPACYWLCREASATRWLALLCASSAAVSPFLLIYAQQAREYGLSAALMLASTAALLRALRQGDYGRSGWAHFALLSTLSLYTSLLSLPLLACHLWYGLWRFRRAPKVLRPLLLSGGASVLAFSPWLWVVGSQLSRVAAMNSGSAEPITPLLYAQTLFLDCSRLFLDVGLPSYQPLPFADAVWITLVAAIELLAIIIFVRRTAIESGGVALLLGSVGLLVPLAADLMLGGRRALVPRYDLPTWLALQLLVVGCLGTWLVSGRGARAWSAGLGLAFLIGCELVSVATYLPRPFWWTSRPAGLAAAASTASRSRIDALIVWPELDGVSVLSLAESLPRDTALIFLDASGRVAQPLPPTLLLYDPGSKLIRSLELRYAMKELTPRSRLWLATELAQIGDR